MNLNRLPPIIFSISTCFPFDHQVDEGVSKVYNQTFIVIETARSASGYFVYGETGGDNPSSDFVELSAWKSSFFAVK